MKSQIEIIAALREQVRQVEGFGHGADRVILSTGWESLNRILPDRGICRGTLVEWIGHGAGAGAGTLGLLVAGRCCAEGGTLVIIDRQGWFYPPAALALGIDLHRVLIVRPASDRDEVWAFDQALRCEAVTAVWGFVERLTGRSFRRLQLSAEAGRSIGMLVRPKRVRHQPSWSHLRLFVEPSILFGETSRYRVELLRCLGGHAGGIAEVELPLRNGLLPGLSES